jgi:hypothetical protein
MLTFSDFKCRWCNPCYLEFSAFDLLTQATWTLKLDVLTKALAQEIKLILSELATDIAESRSGITVDYFQVKKDFDEIGDLMRKEISKYRDLKSGCFKREYYTRTTLAEVLAQGFSGVALYSAYEPNSYGSRSFKIRAHTLPTSPGQHLWFESRVHHQVEQEQFLMQVCGLLQKIPKKHGIDLKAWMQCFTAYEPWAKEHLMLKAPNTTWEQQVPIVFVVGPDTEPLAGCTVKRDSVNEFKRVGDLLMVFATESKWGENQRFFIKARPGKVQALEKQLATGQRSEFKVGDDISGIAVFIPERWNTQMRVGSLALWHFPVKELLQPFVAQDMELAPTMILNDGCCYYDVFKRGAVAYQDIILSTDRLHYLPCVAETTGFTDHRPKKLKEWKYVEMRTYRIEGWDNSLTAWRGRAKLADDQLSAAPYRMAALLLQRLAIDRDKGKVDVRLGIAGHTAFVSRKLERESISEIFGPDWREKDILMLHLAAKAFMQKQVMTSVG